MDAKIARKQKGITLAKLSKDTGLSIALLSKVENGRHKLTTKTKQKLESYYETEITTTNEITTLKFENEQLRNEIELYKDEVDLLHAQLNDLRTLIETIKETINETYNY